MRICNQCKKENNDDAKFCKWCGSKIIVYADVQSQKQTGYYNNNPSSNQSQYNHTRNQQVSSQPIQPKIVVNDFNNDLVSQNKSKKRAILAGILLLGMIGIGGGAFYINSLHKKDMRVAKTYDMPSKTEQPKAEMQDRSADTSRPKEKLQDTITVTTAPENTEDLFYGLYTDGHGINSSAYVVSGSNSRYLTEEDLSQLTLQGLNYAKNEIYARRGRDFKASELKKFFGSRTWYSVEYTLSDETDRAIMSQFNEYEKYNSELLAEKEEQIGPYQLQ